MKELLTKILDRVDDLLDDTKESLTETTRLTLDKLKRFEIHKSGDGTRRRLRSLPLQYLSHPYFNFIMSALLFMGLAIAGIAADNPQAIWTLWLPMPLLAAIVLSGWVDFRVVRKGIMLGIGSFAALSIIYVRLWVGMNGPIPHEAVREVMDLFLAFIASLAVWMTAGRQTIGVYASWLAALGVVFISRLGLSSTLVLFRPDALPIIISLLWGFAALGGAISHSFERNRKKTTSPGPLGFAHTLAAVFGMVLGWLCVRFYLTTPEATTRDMAGAISRGQEAINLVWAKSLLLGWGKDVCLRLASIVTEPMSVEIPAWQGVSGTLGAYGMGSLVFGAVISLAFMWRSGRRARHYGLGISSAPQLALLAAQTLLWLILVGCPNSALPWLILACWTGLGLASGSYARFQADPSQAFEDEEEYSQIGMVCRLGFVGLVEVIVVLGCFISLRPTLASSWIAEMTVEELRDESLGKKINRARVLAPWNPKIELTDALRLREHLQTVSVANWNEDLFQRACDAYERAQRLDPFDPLITLQYAKLLDLAERPDDAQRAILLALQTTPSSETLMEWLYLQASRRRDPEIALQMIQRGILVHPQASKWWLRLYSTEALAGRGPRASRALGTALTGEPENKLIVQAAERRDADSMR